MPGQDDTRRAAAKFTWIPFYEQLADRLVAYRSRQGELLALIPALNSA